MYNKKQKNLLCLLLHAVQNQQLYLLRQKYTVYTYSPYTNNNYNYVITFLHSKVQNMEFGARKRQKQGIF